MTSLYINKRPSGTRKIREHGYRARSAQGCIAERLQIQEANLLVSATAGYCAAPAPAPAIDDNFVYR